MMRSVVFMGIGLAALGGAAAIAGLDVAPAPPNMAGYATTQALQNAITANVPAPATATPPATALDGTPGTSTLYARADHTHAARVQRTVMTTAGDGTVTWMFARPIICAKDKVPPVSYMVEDTTVPPGSPVIVQVTGRTMTSDGTNDTHTGITVKAQRSRALPAAILALTNLVSYDVFGQPAVGTKVNLWAADPTQ